MGVGWGGVAGCARLPGACGVGNGWMDSGHHSSSSKAGVVDTICWFGMRGMGARLDALLERLAVVLGIHVASRSLFVAAPLAATSPGPAWRAAAVVWVVALSVAS